MARSKPPPSSSSLRGFPQRMRASWGSDWRERQVYNACLGESFRCLDLMRESKAYQRARKLPHGEERTAAFKALNEKFGFTSQSIEKFGTTCQKNCAAIQEHTSSQDVQATALRAFKAVQKYAFGKSGKPHFKGFRQFNSVEVKQDVCITFRAEAT